MWNILAVLIVSGTIFLLDGLPLRRRSQKRDFVVFAAILAVSTGLAVLHSLHVRLANPLDWISYVFEPVGRWMFDTLSPKGE
jgi:Ca2+/Na+ antiporter